MISRGLPYSPLSSFGLLCSAAGLVRLVDFGLAKTAREPAHTLCGTPEYLAPEIIQPGGHGREVDWWALGVIAL